MATAQLKIKAVEFVGNNQGKRLLDGCDVTDVIYGFTYHVSVSAKSNSQLSEKMKTLNGLVKFAKKEVVW
jgi:hypothetical protein